MVAFTVPDGARIETIFAVSLLTGFLFSVALFLTAGRFRVPRLRWMKLPKAKLGRKSQTAFSALPGLLPTTIGTWFTSFGLIGLVLRVQLGQPQFTSVIGAAGIATVFSCLFALAFAKAFIGTAKPIEGKALLGSLANVTLTIPENGVGAIAYESDGKRHTIPARTESGEELQSGHRVMVTHVRNGVATVEQF